MARSALFRICALRDLLKSGRLDEWIRLAQDGFCERAVAPRVLYAAVVVPLNREYQFPWYAFLREVRRLAGGEASYTPPSGCFQQTAAASAVRQARSA